MYHYESRYNAGDSPRRMGVECGGDSSLDLKLQGVRAAWQERIKGSMIGGGLRNLVGNKSIFTW